MKMELFAIKDRALTAFMRPWVAQSVGQAIRAFSDMINDKQSEISAHPDDYDLWLIASFDDSTGKITQLADQPNQLVLGKQVLNPKE